MLRRLVALLALCSALPAAAQILEVTDTWPHDGWQTAAMVNTETGARFCAAETRSAFEQVFRIALYEDGDAFLEIRDASWDYVNGDPLRFHLIVGGHERIVTGQGWEGAMSLDLIDDGLRAAMFDRLSHGDRLDIRMPNRSRVAQFSLQGAEPALAAAKDCWAAIRAGGTYQP